jgi:hypothetical protein
MEFKIWNRLKMKLIPDQIHQSEFHQNQSYDRHSYKLREGSVDDQKQGDHHHKNHTQKEIKLYNRDFIQMENELPNCEMNNERQEKHNTDDDITFVLHFLLYLKFRDV